MSPQEFKNLWFDSDCPLSPISLERLNRFSMLSSTISLLTKAGLPNNAAPNLSFVNDSNNIVYGINKSTEQYDFSKDSDKYDKYVVSGSCRDGDAIAINTMEQDIIVELDHEDLFSSAFFNSSIETLVDFLIIYRDFESSVLMEHGEEGYRNGYFSDVQFEDLKTKMLKSDRRALKEKGFWKDELEIIIELRQQYMNS